MTGPTLCRERKGWATRGRDGHPPSSRLGRDWPANSNWSISNNRTGPTLTRPFTRRAVSTALFVYLLRAVGTARTRGGAPAPFTVGCRRFIWRCGYWAEVFIVARLEFVLFGTGPTLCRRRKGWATRGLARFEMVPGCAVLGRGVVRVGTLACRKYGPDGGGGHLIVGIERGT